MKAMVSVTPAPSSLPHPHSFPKPTESSRVQEECDHE